jgi:hypothetical protein
MERISGPESSRETVFQAVSDQDKGSETVTNEALQKICPSKRQHMRGLGKLIGVQSLLSRRLNIVWRSRKRPLCAGTNDIKSLLRYLNKAASSMQKVFSGA